MIWLLAAALVPGAVNPTVTPQDISTTICVPGWTKTIRPPASYTDKLKIQQMQQFGLKGDPHTYEEDHLISLEIGGNPTSPQNLWPQPWTGPENAHEKDRLENLLHKLVCSGKLSLDQAQRDIATDWVATYRQLIGPLP